MRNFDRNNRSDSFGSRSFGGRGSKRRDFGDRDSGGSGKFHTVCDECGRDCEVPFKPTPGKSVYCDSCFGKKNDRPSFGERSFSGRDFDDRDGMFHAVCDECGRDCKVPFRPTSGKPVYCSRCFENKDQISVKHYGERESGKHDVWNKDSGVNNEQLKKQLEILNTKVDKILKMLMPIEEKEVVTTKSLVIEKSKEEKPKKAAKKTTAKKSTIKKKK